MGFTLRYVSKFKPDSLALFATEQLFIVCAPAAFLAFNYIVYGRLISHIGAEHSILKPQKVATIFVISDVSTFLMQVRINVLNEAYGSVGAHENYFSIGWRERSFGVRQDGERRRKGHPRGPYPSIRFLWFLLRPLGQEPHQHQVKRWIPNVRNLQSAYLGVVHFFCLNLRTSTFISTTIVIVER